MIYLGETKSGGRLFRASSIHAADDFVKLFGGSLEYGILLHKWYVIL